MSKSVTKLVPSVPGRRSSHSATKRKLISAAEELFTEHGYAAASLDAIVAGAEVTKGALYHHYSGKQALFEAVFVKIEDESADTIKEALRGHKDPWLKARAGLSAFLQVIQQPNYRRIVIQDGPAVLGYERYREQEERTSFGHVVDIVRDVLAAGGTAGLDEDMVHTFARIFFGALSSAGESVAAAEDKEAAAIRVEAAITFILSGFQALAEQEPAPH